MCFTDLDKFPRELVPQLDWYKYYRIIAIWLNDSEMSIPIRLLNYYVFEVSLFKKADTVCEIYLNSLSIFQISSILPLLF